MSTVCTSVPRRKFILFNKELRGLVKAGYAADLVVFEPDIIADTASYQEPYQIPLGIRHVLVNGKSVVRDGGHTGQRPGEASTTWGCGGPIHFPANSGSYVWEAAWRAALERFLDTDLRRLAAGGVGHGPTWRAARFRFGRASSTRLCMQMMVRSLRRIWRGV